MSPVLIAVHISDGVLTPAWLAGGFLVAVLLLIPSVLRVRDDEIPRIGMLSAAAFIGSQIHIPLGVSSVHLLLNGLIGVILGRRAVLAITIGLVLQAMLFGHGGKLSLGVNICILAIPSMLAGLAFTPLMKLITAIPRPARGLIATLVIALWIAALVTTVQIILWKLASREPRDWLEDSSPMWVAWIPVLITIVVSSGLAAWGVMRKQRGPAFAAGLILGGTCGMLTVLGNALAVYFGGLDGVRVAAPVTFLANLPVVAAEALGVASVVAYLSKVKPEWLIR
jgi:ABC-type Co2+ transport system permease subunit